MVRAIQLLAVSASLASAASLKPREMAARPKFGNVQYGGTSLKTCTTPGKIALTFDDGPSIYTERIVDILEANGAKGTFFIVGENGPSGLTLTQFHGLVKQMHASGHQIAHHSWSHENLGAAGVTADLITSELKTLEPLFAEVIGGVPTYFRPPYTSCGALCQDTLGDLGYHIMDYNLDTNDWKTPEEWDLRGEFEKAIKASNPASDFKVVLAHDIQAKTGAGDFVQFMIDTAKAQGYTEFVTIGECLGDPVGNWYRDPVTGEALGDKPEPPVSSPTVKPPTSTPTGTEPPTGPEDPAGPTTTPTTPPTGGHYTNTTSTVTLPHTTYTTVCPPGESTSTKTRHTTYTYCPTCPEPTGCVGDTCTKTDLYPNPSKTNPPGHPSQPTKPAYPTKPGTTGTGSYTPVKPTPSGGQEVSGAVSRGAASGLLAASFFGALAYLL